MRFFRIATLLMLVCSFSTGLSLAAVSLNVNPMDGSNSIRFRASTTKGVSADRKEVRVRINSTNGQRYQVFQRLIEPLRNEKGESLNAMAIQTSTMSNSNGSGTLYLQNIDRLGMGDQLVYTSAQGGNSDSFVIVYAVDPTNIKNSGRFSGKLVFMVRAIGSSAQDQVAVDMFLESTSSWKVDISGGHSKNRLRVKDSDTAIEGSDYVNIFFTGNAGKDVHIYQDIDALPRSTSGDDMNKDVLQFAVSSTDSKGIRVAGSVPLAPGKVLLYSGPGNESRIQAHFFVDPAKIVLQNAGTYIGKIKYIVETEGFRQDFFIDLECSVQPVFTLDITLPPNGVNFNNILPNAPAQEREIIVTVRSNLHRPYQVVQDLQSPMTNEKGQEIKKEQFTMKVEVPTRNGGQTNFMDFKTIERGEYPIFSSDARGTPVTFKVLYRLQGSSQMYGGSFAAPIRFSLNQK